MRQPHIVIRTHGPGWDDSRPMENQADWPTHATFMNSLAAERFVLLGGPLEGTRDVVLVMLAEDCSEIMDRLAADPWTQEELLTVKECQLWSIHLGSLR